MPRIREDLVGVVWAGGRNLLAGAVVPDGVRVAEELVAVERVPEPVAEVKPAGRKPRARKSEE